MISAPTLKAYAVRGWRRRKLPRLSFDVAECGRDDERSTSSPGWRATSICLHVVCYAVAMARLVGVSTAAGLLACRPPVGRQDMKRQTILGDLEGDDRLVMGVSVLPDSQRLDNRPLFIHQVCWISPAIHDVSLLWGVTLCPLRPCKFMDRSGTLRS